MGSETVTYSAAFLAGFLSFLTPCVLPLVPVYLSILSGTSFDQMTGKSGGLSGDELSSIQKRIISNAIAFIFGFSFVFIVAGVAAGTFGDWLIALQGDAGKVVTNGLLLVFGPLLLMMGFNMSGLWKPTFLNSDKRFSLQKGKLGVLSSGVVGAAFAFGWAPCIGPILMIILGLAAKSGSKMTGAFLLATYSLGLGVPFFLSALSVNGLISFSQRFRRHFDTLELGLGAVLVVTGLSLGLIGMDGFRFNTNGLDLVRQKIPSLDEFVIRQEEKIMNASTKTDSLDSLEDEDGNQITFENDE